MESRSLLKATPRLRPGLHQAEPSLHTTLGQSCQAREAKSSFLKTRPHPQVGSQPFVWKKTGLLVLTSSKPAFPAQLRACDPACQ